MGQEERKNKAKLEKTQIQLASNSSEYETAVKILEETTGRWNKEWKAACDVRNASSSPCFFFFSPQKLIDFLFIILEIPRSRRGTVGFFEEQLMELCKHSLDGMC